MSASDYRFTWVASDGRTTELTAANGYNVLLGIRGLDAPTPELTTERRTGSDGSLMVNRRTGVRNLLIPFYVNNGGSSRDAIATLSDVFRGPGTLRVSRDGVTYRDLRQVYYETGLEGDEDPGVSFPDVWRKCVVSLQAMDPWWYGATVGPTSVALGGVTTFDDAGVTFDSSTTQFDGGDATAITVSGHADAYPVWTLTGPFTTLILEVAGSGAFTLNAALAGGSTITVDTRPGQRGPSLGTGAVDWSLLSADSILPTLSPGSESISVVSTGTTGSSAITMTYEPRWLTP